jgi:hypothetical protein
MTFSVGMLSLQSCSKYTVITSQRDPADSYYKEKIATTFFWGLLNKPDRIVDTSCGSAGLDEVKVLTSPGYSVINIVTLGIVNIVKLQWKCRKPAPVVGFQP